VQLIAPLVPSRVNEENLQIGNDVYGKLLDQKPDIALVSEQAYSQSLISHFNTAGYEAIIMDWNNPSRVHPEWDRQWQYKPQLALDERGNTIPVLWSSSVAFQKFQRYISSEIDFALKVWLNER